MLRRNGTVVKSVESVLRLEGSQVQVHLYISVRWHNQVVDWTTIEGFLVVVLFYEVQWLKMQNDNLHFFMLSVGRPMFFYLRGQKLSMYEFTPVCGRSVH